MEKIYGGFKVGEERYSYGSEKDSFDAIRAEIEVDNVEDGINFMVNYFGKNIPASPFFSWSYSDAKTTERRNQLIAAINGKAEEKATTVEVEEPEEEILCSCGRSVPKSVVMTSSTGHCCPDCYDSRSK